MVKSEVVVNVMLWHWEWCATAAVLLSSFWESKNYDWI